MEALARAVQSKRALRPTLLTWFERHQRDLPWRHAPTPYAVWVSEVMLQQTQVERVRGYFERFMARFPTVQALAAASVAEVLSMWSGLGYYSRARTLHRAAQQVMETFGGSLPSTHAELRTLPGFGPYTAGAVASIAFGLEAPLVDGNVARVLSRLFDIDGAPGTKAREALLWQIAEALVTGPNPGDFNQSLMELGATVCLPSNPLCLLCPVKQHCTALATGRVDVLPPPKRAATKKRLDLAVASVRRGDTVLLARRKEKGLFGGLWELPSAPIVGLSDGDAVLQALLGRRATIGPELIVIERVLTHRHLRLHLHPVELSGRLGVAPEDYAEWRWVARGEAASLGMSSATEAVLAQVLPDDQGAATSSRTTREGSLSKSTSKSKR